MQTRSDPSPPDSTSTGTADPFGLALVRTAGGDPQLLAVLRQLAWESYVAAGAPCGWSERGMALWWSGRLTAVQN
ncbi:MAG TPA: hypothetical protein VK002_15450 [Rubricoccaceae bacterium]|nr:hypothetical protein [Rubricoccaceae bacterium]